MAHIALGIAGGSVRGGAQTSRPVRESLVANSVTLFLCGDVMLGRGIDQILAHPSDPGLHEDYVRDARRYVALAEAVNGRIPRKVDDAYVWGEALTQWQRKQPDARIINLETSITRHDRPWPKGINYRMHPDNIGVLRAARIDCCGLANNHVLDWQREGLIETLTTLRAAGISSTGAGSSSSTARAPAVIELADRGRVLVFAAATGDSGVPERWEATAERSGVHRLRDLSAGTVARVAQGVSRYRRAGDLVVFSVHWGGNWGDTIPKMQREFAHALIDEAGVDLVHGHSSHHPKAIEVHHGHLILYGCGDFLNDYEGIGGHEEFRSELGFMYFPRLDAADGQLQELALVPTRMRRFRVDSVSDDERQWLMEMLRRECDAMGCGIEETGDGTLALRW